MTEKTIACDPDKIERVILNVLSNAAKFTKRGGSIDVNMFDDAEHVVITVKDTGIGIPKDNHEDIFLRFRQVNKTFTREKEGSGIGLFLVKSIIELHGGNIKLESEYGKGSKFIIRLPIVVLPGNDFISPKEHDFEIQNRTERINVEFSDIY